VFFFLKVFRLVTIFKKCVFGFEREKTFHTLDQTWPRFSRLSIFVENDYQSDGMR
jgi:hypothetical protein